MASLVTLDVAKSHLRVVDSAFDDDIERKVEQASGIILDYLKGRANNVRTIVSSSVANPTVITTEDAHQYVTGNVATIEDHGGSAPAIDGDYTVTVLSSKTFSIPVAVTVAGTGGTATVAWDDQTVPSVVQAAVLLMLGHLYENRGDDSGKSFRTPSTAVWDAIERLLMRSRDPAMA